MSAARALAAAQTVPIAGDVEANVAQHLRLVDAAAGEGVRVLVFPELSLTGYELDLAEDLAFSERDPRLGPLVEAARSSSITLVVGAPVRIDEQLVIGALLVSPNGALELYTKHHLGAFSASAGGDGVLPPAEACVFQPGDRDPLVHVGGWTAAVAVCADTGRASHAQRAAARGARAYLASVFVITSELERECAKFEALAVRHAMAVVVANYGGPSGGLAAAGRSAIWSERGERLAALDASGAGVVVAVERGARWRANTIRL